MIAWHLQDNMQKCADPEGAKASQLYAKVSSEASQSLIATARTLSRANMRMPLATSMKASF